MNNFRFSLYVVGEKGFHVVQEAFLHYGSTMAYVVIGKDSGVFNDFFNVTKGFCLEKNIPFFERGAEPSCSDGYELLYKICVGWRWLMTDKYNLIVLHDSKLPAYRGFNPLVTALLNKDNEISVSAILANDIADSGDIIACKSRNIQYPIKIYDAIKLSIELYVEIVLFLLEKLSFDEKISTYKQSDNFASFSVWRDESDYFIDWEDDADYISRFCDAVGYPYGGAKTYLNGEIIRVVECVSVDDLNIAQRKKNLGKILMFYDGKPVVICGSGLLKLNRIENLSDFEQISNLSIRTKFTAK